MNAAPASLRVRLLGGLAVDGMSDADFGSRKARTLVKALVLARGSPISVGALAEIVWTDDQPTRPSEQIGVLVSRLRRAVGADRLVRSEAGFALRVDWLDVDELRDLVEQASTALRESRFAVARAAAGAALALVRGALLPDDEGDWLEAERAAAATTVTRAHGLAATAALRSGDHLAAELAAESALAQDPWDEVALRTLMQAQVAGGRPASALASYARMRERLADELGVSPSPETEALHTALLLGNDDVGPVSLPVRGQLIGRDRELELLEAMFVAARTDVRVSVVIGEAGIGKTALVEHFAERARATGARTLMAYTDELGRDLPLQPVLDALRLAGDAMGSHFDDFGEVSTVPDTAGDRVRWFSSVLRELTTGSSPTVLVIDDVHWADGATREWMSWAQRRPGALLVVAVGRPGTLLAGATELVVAPLSSDSIGRLIDAGGDPARAAEVYERSGGNPLFALAVAGAADDALPASVHEAVASTLARLDPATEELVRAGAVLDAAVDVDLLAAVLRRPAIDVLERMERAAGAGLFVERGPGFEFRHGLVREALVASTGAARRALLHREAARVLQDRPNREALAVAVHARLGGASDLAAPAFLEAAAVSLSRSDLPAAEEQLRASLHAVDTAEARAALGRVLMIAGRLNEAATEWARAIDLGGGVDALEGAGWVDYYRRRYDRAQRFADEAASRATARSPIRASALALGGRVRHAAGDTRGAEERLVDALEGPAAVRGVAEVWLGQLRVHEGRPVEALELFEHALIDPSHLAHPFAAFHGRFSRVMALGQLGRVGDALRAGDELRDAIVVAEAVGARFRTMHLNARAWLLRAVGRLAEADEHNRAAIELNGATDGSGPASKGLGEPYWVGWLDLVDGRLASDDPDGAASILRSIAAIDDWDGTMAWHQRHRLGLMRARIAHAAGDKGLASQLAADVKNDAATRSTARYEALAHVQLALFGADGDRERLDRSLGTLRRCAALELPTLLEQLGRQFGDDGWRGEAVERRAALSGSLQ